MKNRLSHYSAFRERLEAARLYGTPLTPGSVRVFHDSQTSFAEILKRVQESEKSIEMRAFLWRDDEIGNRLGQAILDAAERGVRVTIHKDRQAAVYEYAGGNKQSFFHKRIHPTHALQAWFLGAVFRVKGSIKQRPNPLAQAILDHPNITVDHQRRRYDHSKVFVFDDRYLTLGSMGIGDNHHDEWIDVMVEIDGAEHVERLGRRMNHGVEFDPGRDIDFLVHSKHAENRGHCSMLTQRLAIIEAAEVSLTIEMAYLGDRRFTAALLRAIKRGVDVTLVTAARADVLGNLNRATCDKLLRRTGAPKNLSIIHLPRMVHSKIVIADGLMCDVGSANFTPLSHGVYEEINMYAVDATVAGELEDAVDRHIAEGQSVTHRVGYGKLGVQVERAVLAYQSRRRARMRRPPRPKLNSQERLELRQQKRAEKLEMKRARKLARKHSKQRAAKRTRKQEARLALRAQKQEKRTALRAQKQEKRTALRAQKQEQRTALRAQKQEQRTALRAQKQAQRTALRAQKRALKLERKVQREQAQAQAKELKAERKAGKRRGFPLLRRAKGTNRPRNRP